MKIKNKNLKNKKNKKFIFFFGQEIKNPDLSGKIRKKAEIPKKIFWLIDLGNFQNLDNFIFEPKFRRKSQK